MKSSAVKRPPDPTTVNCTPAFAAEPPYLPESDGAPVAVLMGNGTATGGEQAVVAFIDRLPQLMTHLDEDILPVIGSLGSVGTDVHDLLDTMQDLRHVVKGFPGSRLFRRRGAEEIAEDEEQQAADGR